MEKIKGISNTLILVLIILTLIGGANYYFFTQKNITNEVNVEESHLNVDDYNVEFRYKEGTITDGKLVLKEKINGEEKVVIESTDELKNEMLDQGLISSTPGSVILDYSFIRPVGLSSSGEEIYFMLFYEYVGPLFAYNINSSNIRRIESFHLNEPYVFSLNGDKAISLSNYPAKNIYLVDFEKDSRELIYSLGERETFEQKIRELDAVFDIKWLNNQKIQATVYKDEAEDYGDVNTLSKIIVIDLTNGKIEELSSDEAGLFQLQN